MYTGYRRLSISDGFSLIELVVTIVILSILSIVATTKFIDLQSDAREALIKSVGGAMKSSIKEIYALAAIQGKEVGNQTIVINGVSVPLKNGAPAVDSSVGFPAINSQLKAWLDIDTIDRDSANADRSASVLFSDKSTAGQRIYIYFSEFYDTKGSTQCYIRYQNKNNGPEVDIYTSDC